MSTLDVIADILREVAPRALKAKEIAALAAGRLPSASKTPATVISRDLALDLRDREASSRFLRVDRGAFVLKEALPTALYNEIESYPAAWTRNLIAAGEIAAGVVDERSIRDLRPVDVASYRQCHFFSGIGVWSRALRDAGIPDDAHVWTGSCPCTPFSSAGRKRGFDDEQHLWPEWFRLIKACRPAWIFGEQVSSKDGLIWLDAVRADLEDADYTFRVLSVPAACAGAPHARHRLYFVAYARERGCEILRAPWLHDRGQPRNDAARCGTPDGGAAGAVSDSDGPRPQDAEDAGADRSDEGACPEADERRTAGDLEPERGGDADGSGCPCIGAVAVVDAGFARSGRDTGALPRAEEVGAGERLEAGDLADEPVAASADDVARNFRPGDRVRIDGDPGWGGAVRGYWASDVEWIYCRPEPGHEDGRWRPVKSGTQPLVDGAAPELGRTRTRRLKGFGNAIVLPLATLFVETVIEELAAAAQSGLADQLPAPMLVRKPSIKRRKQLKLSLDGVPADEVLPVGEVMPVGEVLPVGEVFPVGEVMPVGEVLPVGEVFPVGEVMPVGEVLPVGEVFPVGEVTPA